MSDNKFWQEPKPTPQDSQPTTDIFTAAFRYASEHWTDIRMAVFHYARRHRETLLTLAVILVLGFLVIAILVAQGFPLWNLHRKLIGSWTSDADPNLTLEFADTILITTRTGKAQTAPYRLVRTGSGLVVRTRQDYLCTLTPSGDLLVAHIADTPGQKQTDEQPLDIQPGRYKPRRVGAASPHETPP